MAGHDLSAHAADVAGEYDAASTTYMTGWHPRHIHFGVFDPGETYSESYLRTHGVDPKRHDRAVVKMIEDVIAPAHITADSLVVDAGCGVGGTAFHLCETRQCKVIGLNISEGQLEIARNKARDQNLDQLVEFRFSDCASELCLEDCSVDVIVTIEAACHFANRAQFLCECARVLRPNGRIVAQDWLASDAASEQEYAEFIQPICDSWSMIGLETVASYVDKLTKAGLEVVEFEDFGPLVFPNAEILHATTKVMKLGKFMGMLPSDMELWMRRLEFLSRAWFAGHFQVHRFCVRKPG